MFVGLGFWLEMVRVSRAFSRCKRDALVKLHYVSKHTFRYTYHVTTCLFCRALVC